MLKRAVAVCVAAVTAASVLAGGPCGEWDGRLARVPAFDGGSGSGVQWDPDGNGPLPPGIVIAGTMSLQDSDEPVERLALWDGSGWRALGTFNAFVSVVTTWDPDGPGGQPARLIAGGQFTVVDGVQVNHVALYDGASWHALGTGLGSSFSDIVNALESWDPDGSGPLPPKLVAAGLFVSAGGNSVNNIASWDGTAWHALGSGTDEFVKVLTSWDSDGPGPLATELIAGGNFTVAGGVAAVNVARWNGVSWQSMGSIFPQSGTVNALHSWDVDGPGPAQAGLYASAEYVPTPGVLVKAIAFFAQTEWFQLELNTDLRVLSFASWDPDGPGPAQRLLAVGGASTRPQLGPIELLLVWDGVEWAPPGAGILGTASVSELLVVDPDGAGPLGDELIAIGGFTQAGGQPIERVARWDRSSWTPLAPGPQGPVRSLTAWDPDAAGPLPPRLVAGGTFLRERDSIVNRVAQWDGDEWLAVGSGFNAGVNALMTIDPDGGGPLESELIAGGSFTASDATVLSRVARWAGGAWQPQGFGVSNAVRSMAAWDPDGGGSIPDRLTIAGDFMNAAGPFGNHVVRWNGTSWQAIGTGLPDDAYAVCAWDADGDGPQGAALFAGGDFNEFFEVGDYLQRSTGGNWVEVGGNLNGDVLALTTWDPDGNGPLVEQLIAGGAFTVAAGVGVNGVARWDGAMWHALGGGVAGGAADVYAVASFDPDDGGPLAPVLVVGGEFVTAGGVTVNNIAMWDGAMWHALGEGTNDAVRAVAVWDPDGAGPTPGQLVIGGDFTEVDGRAERYVALWTTLGPEITDQPDDRLLEAGAGTTIAVRARNGSVMYEWRKDGVALVDGPQPSGSFIALVDRPTMFVYGAQVEDSGAYECFVSNQCGGLLSDPAVVTVTPPPPSCGGDANGDDVVDGADLSVLLGQFGQSVVPGTGADFNGDGAVDGADLSVLLFRFGTAC